LIHPQSNLSAPTHIFNDLPILTENESARFAWIKFALNLRVNLRLRVIDDKIRGLNDWYKEGGSYRKKW